MLHVKQDNLQNTQIKYKICTKRKQISNSNTTFTPDITCWLALLGQQQQQQHEELGPLNVLWCTAQALLENKTVIGHQLTKQKTKCEKKKQFQSGVRQKGEAEGATGKANSGISKPSPTNVWKPQTPQETLWLLQYILYFSYTYF